MVELRMLYINYPHLKSLLIQPAIWISAFLFLFLAFVLVLTFAAGLRYEGHWFFYLLFTLLANTLLANGFRKNAIFFDTFIGIFLWLGFWLKFSVRVAFTSGIFHEPVGAFGGSAEAFDKVLMISSCGFLALLFASIIRARFFTYSAEPSPCDQSGLFRFYQVYRAYCISVFLGIVASVAVTNIWLEIYQRGMVAQTILPFGLNGVYKWLLQFGLASISALIIRFEIELNRNISLIAIFPPLLEGFFSNVSLLSRGMILNSTALGIGGLRVISAMRVRVNRLSLFLALISFVILFLASLFVVNYIRATNYSGGQGPVGLFAKSSISVLNTGNIPRAMFLDRWVGIEGVMAVSSSRALGWDLWRDAWNERFQDGRLSLYDSRFIDSPYKGSETDKPKNHFVSLPGVIAFMYYPGSFWFLFLGIVVMGLFTSLLEIATFRFAGQNWVLCSLIAQVVAYRLAGFGYVPGQSYLLLGAILVNISAIFLIDKILSHFFASDPGRKISMHVKTEKNT
jgi:hypothetical protein